MTRADIVRLLDIVLMGLLCPLLVPLVASGELEMCPKRKEGE